MGLAPKVREQTKRIREGGLVIVRRLFKTLPGKLLCQVLAAVITLPYLTFGLVARAAAEPFAGAATQLTSNRLWAVMPFVDDHGGKLGGIAADRFAEELQKRQGEFRPPVDVLSSDAVKRVLDTLQLNPPITD